MAPSLGLNLGITGVRGVAAAGRNASVFDGSADYATRTSEGLDSYKIFQSIWLKFNGGDGSTQHIRFKDDSNFYIQRMSSGNLRIRLISDSGVIITGTQAVGPYAVAQGWIHSMFSGDFDAAGANKFAWYVNNTLISTSFSNNYTVDLVAGTDSIGGSNSGASKLNGSLSEVIEDRSFLDLSVQANRELLWKDGKPVYVGADGSIPFGGVQPHDYFPDGDPSNQKGSGTAYAITGALGSEAGPGA